MPLVPGTRLGPYEIASAIGAGGMGEVYKALDTRLDRTVAIKVLPATLAADPQFRERFDREARTISQLNHPHICTLHDIGHHAAAPGQPPTDYLVLEFLEGQTLAARIEKGPLPLDEALRIAIEICDGLDRAHSAGVVHRDLKPGNVFLARRGGPSSAAITKLLDFGLAKATVGGVTVDGERPAVTMTTPLTAQGTILGTFQYMSPEQIEGADADARSDIWAFGCVLYEMLTGRRAFVGRSQASLMASILKEMPQPVAEIVAVTPPALDRIIRACLTKNPEDRWQSARDLRRELGWIGVAAESAGPSAPSAGRSRARYLGAIAIGAALVGAVWVARSWSRPTPPARAAIEFNIPVRRYNRPLVGIISPDQTGVAYVAPVEPSDEPMLWIRRFSDAEPRALEGTTGANWPFWSPSGTEVAYFAAKKLWVVTASGGRPRPICDASYGVGGAWGETGAIVFTPAFLHGLSRVDPASGRVEPLTTLDPSRKESVHGWPVFLPGGRKFLFLSRTTAANVSRIEIGTLDGGPRIVVTDADALVGYAAPRLLYVRNGVLWGQAFDPDRGAVSGQPESVVEPVRFSEAWATSGASVQGQSLAYVPHRPFTVVATWFDAAGRKLGDAFEDTDASSPRISPDGSAVLFERADPAHGADDLWVRDLARKTRARLTSTRWDEDPGPWSRDGRQVYFGSDGTGPYAIMRSDADGLAPAETVLSGPSTDWVPHDISRDGRWLIAGDDSANDLWLIPLDQPAKKVKWLASEFGDSDARFSPDGRWLTFEWNRSGAVEVYARSFDGGAPIAISNGGGSSARWSPDGRTIYYVAPGGRLMAASITSSDKTISLSPSRLLLIDSRLHSFDVAPDGRLLVLLRTSSESTPLRIRIGLRY